MQNLPGGLIPSSALRRSKPTGGKALRTLCEVHDEVATEFKEKEGMGVYVRINVPGIGDIALVD